jgi:hypothetical protein
MTDPTAGPAETQSRARYLLDGRRVTLSDLLSAGLLAEGEHLTFVRPRMGETHEATVTARPRRSAQPAGIGLLEVHSPRPAR